jgi:hypothetical protein
MRESYRNFVKAAKASRKVRDYIVQIKKTRQLENISKEQFEAIKLLLDEFSSRFRGRSYQNVVSGMIEIVADNLQMEVTSTDTTKNPTGYYYLDAESVIDNLYERFAKLEDRRFTKYISPVANIGFSYLRFPNNPTIKDENGENSISNLYVATEKLGLQFRIWNYRYTHGKPVGETYRYYLRTYRNTHQRTQPLISNFHVSATGSGLLYNIVNAKSDKKFNYALAQGSAGFTFFNGLCLDFGVGTPFNSNKFSKNNLFYSFSVDIPLLDYIRAGKQE